MSIYCADNLLENEMHVNVQLGFSSQSFTRQLFCGAACAFGVFDGLHKGHAQLISYAQEDVLSGRASRSITITFDRDPDEIFHPNRLHKLMSNEERVRALSSYSRAGDLHASDSRTSDLRAGDPCTLDSQTSDQCMGDANANDSLASDLLLLPFVPEFYKLSPRDFLDFLFGENGNYAPYSLHVGEGFRFGAKAAGTTADLQVWAKSVGTKLSVHPLLQLGGSPITSTRIRLLLESGQDDLAFELLGHSL